MISDWFNRKKSNSDTVIDGEPQIFSSPHPAQRTKSPRLFAIGDSIGGEYKVLQVMRGGMGVVYVVHHHELEGPIVLKSLLQPEDSEATHFFRREAETWIQFGAHPNLVQAFWANEIQGDLFVAAEFVEPDEMRRNSLADYIRFGRIPDPIVLKWIAHFCYGMEHAMRNGMLAHRDIKPGNLMVDRSGDLKITDFGLARPIELLAKELGNDYPASPSQTLAGAGTPAYMAPEQILSTAALDYRVDIYAFGVSLYEMCVGTPPFNGGDLRTILQMHLSAAHKPTGTVFDPMIDKCMAKRPTERFQTFSEILEEAAMIAKGYHYYLPPRPSPVDAESESAYAKALSYSTLGKPDLAMLYTNEYIRVRPNDYRGWTQKGRLCFEVGKLREALEATEKSLDLNPTNTHAWNNLGLILERQNCNLEAVGALLKAIDFDPFNTGAMLNLGSLLPELGRADEAKEFLLRALKLQPEKATIWHNLGYLLLKMGELKEARECYEKALELNPKLDQTRQALTLLNSGAISPNPALLMQQGRMSEAKRLLIEQTSADAGRTNAWHNLGLIYLHETNFAEAKRCFANVLRSNANDEFALQTLVKLHTQDGEFEMALVYCERLGTLPEREVAALAQKAQILQAMGQDREAIGLLKTMVAKNPALDQVWFVLGEVYLRSGHKQEALDAFLHCEQLIKSDHQNTDNLQLVRERIAYLKSR
jgi:serine/threonine protein kinase/predicted negative regulator of RcsB-dependent stress response